MEVKKISARMKSIITCISNTDKIIVDVGCDHCYTSIYAFIYKNIDFCYNIDVNKKPLETGVNNLTRFGYLNKTKNIVNDGLKNLSLDKDIDCCIISGLGGHKVIDILDNINPVNKINKFIICVNDHPQLIENWINNKKMHILKQEVIKNKRKDKIYNFFLFCFN